MTMFRQPLQHDPEHSFVSQLLPLYDAYCEFQCYCAFVHLAHSSIVSHDPGLDDDAIVGFEMSTRCLVARSNEIKRYLDEVFKHARQAEQEDA